MENNEIVPVQQELYISPVVSLDGAKAKFEQVREYTASCLTKGTDYGTIDGVSKPTLLKPGAEKIGSLFGLSPRFECVDRILNFTGEGNPDNEPFFYFEYRCSLYKGDQFVGSCDGSCNSWEKKYRYRNAELVCPNCGKPLRKSKTANGFYCWAKTGGCGATFQSNDIKITSQKLGKIKNMDTAEQVNTFQKMAQKRAYVGAILIACNLSEYYTQDVEDMADFIPEPEYIEGNYEPVTPQNNAQRNSKPVSGSTPINTAPKGENAPESAQKREFDEEEFLRQWSKPGYVPGMNRKSAEEMPDSQGQPYGKKSTKELFFMLQMILKKIDGASDEQREQYQLKVSAICEILQNRKLALTLGSPS